MPSSEWVSSSSWADRPDPPERPLLPSKEHRQHTHTSDPGTQILVLKQCGRELALRMSDGDWDWNPRRKVSGRTTLGPELRARLVLSSLPRAWSACWSCPQPGFLSRGADIVLSECRWPQVSRPGAPLAVCSSSGLHYPTGINWKLGPVVAGFSVPGSRELSCVCRTWLLWAVKQAQEHGSIPWSLGVGTTLGLSLDFVCCY